MQFSNILSSGLSNFLFSICIQAATLTVCSPYLEARVTSPNFGMMLFKQNGQFFVVICLGTLKKYVLNEYLSKHLCKNKFWTIYRVWSFVWIGSNSEMSKSEICLNFRSVAWNRILGRTRISFSNTFEKHTVLQYNIVPLDQCGINQKPTQGSIWGLHRQSKIFHKYEI